MSRIGKMPISVPDTVQITVLNHTVMIKGPLGTLSLKYDANIEITIDNDTLLVKPLNDQSNKLWGTYRTLLDQMIIGVTQGYVYNLELIGVGYKASVESQNLVLKLGFSHDVVHPIRDGVNIICRKPTFISIIGIDKQLVSQEAAKIRSYKKPEPYKGKGIIYENEVIVRKEGKKK